MLYIVSTPIGNMADVTNRALETLKSCDLILAEDTRRTGKLLKHHSIEKRMLSYNDHNKHRRLAEIADMMKTADIALVTDSGTPTISDPGYLAINMAIDNNVMVIPIPGPSAFVVALSVSGFPTDRFTFNGFLPKKKSRKITALSQEGLQIFYESPYRIIKTLELIHETRPKARLCVARELTKRFETIYRGTAREILGQIKPKGEFVLIIHS